jgi:GH15 family glucan-1,4-alpha-glucosidase
MYKGVTTLGMGKYCAVYSPTEQFCDGFSRGVQHLFYEDYKMNLLKMAVTVNRLDAGEVEYANIKYNGINAPEFIAVTEEGSEKLYDVFTRFNSKKTKDRKTTAYALKDILVMEEEITNTSKAKMEIMQYAYIFFNNDEKGAVKYDEAHQCIIWTNSISSKNLIIGLQDKAQRVYLSKEPKYSAIITMQKILKAEEEKEKILLGSNGLSAALGRNTELMPGEKNVFSWYIIPCSTIDKGIEALEGARSMVLELEANRLYEDFFKRSVTGEFIDKEMKKAFYRNLLAIKAVNLNGMVPADVIGYYYSSHGTPSFYVRDSLMVARGFIYSGYLKEAGQIIKWAAQLPLKRRGEFYQRYDCFSRPAEGANNDIKHQMDSNGYFLSLIYQYFIKTGELLTTEKRIEDILEFISESQLHNGLAGPEGGVNEGVYGASYITSTNMFLAGGLYHTKDLLKGLYDSRAKNNEEYTSMKLKEMDSKIDNVLEYLEQGINSMWDKDRGYYKYGYSETCEADIDRYDTPQYFAMLYGYPNTEKIKENNRYLLQNASLLGEGIGYSQQSYHHGPWIFNTAACAQYNFLNGNTEDYFKKLRWIIQHFNGYGLAPEAISLEDEKVSFNNPLSWACAEVVATIALPGHLIDKNKI